ncbi:toll-like receptor 5 [Centropristis striata]|uniref:toll-like receptor 5 n=1 Tax=Centropristis striata TaxID=184440 RepID=UPI0027E1A48A|nr:toll-like receptor 5 [Centropristis striata]
MWTLALQLVFLGLYLQVPTSYSSCTLYQRVADCGSRYLSWVPALPSNITHLYLQTNNISEIKSSSLREYDQLQELDLGNQKGQLIIRNNAFLRQRKLTRLVLGSNEYLQMEPRAFAGLYNLKQLFLDKCNLADSILSESYLQPLWSLEKLDLLGNDIVRLRPGRFFSRLTKFTELNLKLNKIEKLCEEDLIGFRGKNFNLSLQSNHFRYGGHLDWESCGNPFRGMAFVVLDLSNNGFNAPKAKQFFKAIAGTQINHLIFSGFQGKGFSHDNFPDPDESTFGGLINSSVRHLELLKSNMFALKKAFLSPLRDAKIIDLSLNKINQITNNAFDGLQGHLRMLNLSFNLLGGINSYTFTNLTDLRVLDLSYNHIGVLGDKAFSGLPNLRALYLTGNSLRNLGFPAPLPNLDFLLLSDNKLEHLYSISEFGKNSYHVDISENRLKQLGDIYDILIQFSRLQNLFYGGNFIKWCKPSQSIIIPYNSSLLVLDLHDSSLNTIWAQGECLDLFDRLDNLLGLNISFNSLAALPQAIFRGLSSIIEIDLSYNALTYLEPDIFPVSLKRLDLSNNFLASPDPETFRTLSVLSLAANRFHCYCTLESFLNWLNVTLPDQMKEYRCEFPAALQNLPLLDYFSIIEPCEEDDEMAVQDLKFVLFIFSALLIITVTLSGITYAHLRGYIFIIYKKIISRVVEGPKPPPPVDRVQYDAFFCYSCNDYRWVETALLKKLDDQFSEENIFRCCFEARDFLPGEDHLSNIRDAIWGSRKTVCIVSKEFLKDGWCLEAFTLAQGRMLEELTNVLIMLVVGKVAHYQLMKCNAVRAFVKRREYLTWPEDPQDLEWFYERLVSQILKDTKVKKFAEDKTEPEVSDIQPQNEDDIQLENLEHLPCEF